MGFLTYSRYEQYYGIVSEFSCKNLYYLSTILFIGFFYTDELIGYTSEYHRQFSLVCKLTLFANFLLFWLTRQKYLPDGIHNIFVIDICILVLTISILISGIRHGLFKTNEK